MGLFEKFPYTNFHDLNLDWILEVMKDFFNTYPEVVENIKNKMDKPINAGTDGNLLIKDGDGSRWGDFGESIDFQQYVNNWLDEHPEATTTVEDGSLTQAKFTDELKLETIKDYIIPEMFGAVGDGETDDTVALQNTINYASSNKMPIMLISNYYITGTIDVPSYVTLTSFGRTYMDKRIYVSQTINVAFRCGYRCDFSNFTIMPKTDTYTEYTAFYFDGRASNNVDSKLDKVLIKEAQYGVINEGRNLEITRTNFSHCRYGFFQNTPELDQNRGIILNSCRFHGIGEDMATIGGQSVNMIENGSCAGILLDCDRHGGNTSDVTQVQIINCLSDQGGTFVKGRVNRCLIESCLIVTYRNPAFMFESTEVNPSFDGIILINGNCIYGKNGSDTTGTTHPVPDYALVSNGYGNIQFSNNSLGELYNVCHAINSRRITIENNIYIPKRVGTSNPNYMFVAQNSSLLVCNGNTIYRYTAYVGCTDNSGRDNSEVYAFNNHNVNPAPTTGNLIPIHNVPYTMKFRGDTTVNNGDTITDLNKLDRFQIRTTTGHMAFELTRVTSDYWTSTYARNTANGNMAFCEVSTDASGEIAVTVNEITANGITQPINIKFVVWIPC